MTRISRLYLIPFIILYAVVLGQNWSMYTAALMMAAVITWRGPIWSRLEVGR
jgi:hypothetical protein